jgi:hypothetical protein
MGEDDVYAGNGFWLTTEKSIHESGGWDGDYEYGFHHGAEWCAAGFAVCEFLTDLAKAMRPADPNAYFHGKRERDWLPGFEKEPQG